MLYYKIDVLGELKKKGYTQYRLREEKILGGTTVTLLKDKKMIGMTPLDTICEILDKQPGEIIGHKKEGERNMMREKSHLYSAASIAIGNNGIRILKTPKFANEIVETEISYYKNRSLAKINWLDKDGKVVVELMGAVMLDDNYYPMIGKITKIYQEEK